LPAPVPPAALSTQPPVTGERVLLVRLPCNPIFPVGPIYLADHLHKRFPTLPQEILDLAAVPVLDVRRVLRQAIDRFRPTLLVFSWRDIQIYAPVDGREAIPSSTPSRCSTPAIPCGGCGGPWGAWA